jgi:hypothetical protein
MQLLPFAARREPMAVREKTPRASRGSLRLALGFVANG